MEVEISYRTIRAGLCKKMAFEQRLGKGERRTKSAGRSFQALLKHSKLARKKVWLNSMWKTRSDRKRAGERKFRVVLVKKVDFVLGAVRAHCSPSRGQQLTRRF